MQRIREAFYDISEETCSVNHESCPNSLLLKGNIDMVAGFEKDKFKKCLWLIIIIRFSDKFYKMYRHKCETEIMANYRTSVSFAEK
jgi:hypothetical protein